MFPELVRLCGWQHHWHGHRPSLTTVERVVGQDRHGRAGRWEGSPGSAPCPCPAPWKTRYKAALIKPRSSVAWLR